MAEYKKLIVWEKSIDFCTDIYRVTRSFPSKEDFGITSQLRRASVSIPSNIAEGSKRSTDKDFRSFLRIASWFWRRNRNPTTHCIQIKLFRQKEVHRTWGFSGADYENARRTYKKIELMYTWY